MTIALICFAALLAYREYLHNAERAKLLNRIQAPQMVIQQEAATHNPLVEVEPDLGPWTPPPIED